MHIGPALLDPRKIPFTHPEFTPRIHHLLAETQRALAMARRSFDAYLWDLDLDDLLSCIEEETSFSSKGLEGAEDKVLRFGTHTIPLFCRNSLNFEEQLDTIGEIVDEYLQDLPHQAHELLDAIDAYSTHIQYGTDKLLQKTTLRKDVCIFDNFSLIRYVVKRREQKPFVRAICWKEGSDMFDVTVDNESLHLGGNYISATEVFEWAHEQFMRLYNHYKKDNALEFFNRAVSVQYGIHEDKPVVVQEGIVPYS